MKISILVFMVLMSFTGLLQAQDIKDTNDIKKALVAMKTGKDTTERTFNKVVELSMQLKYPFGTITALVNHGNKYINAGQYDAGLADFDKALALCDSTNVRTRIFFSTIANNKGVICQFRNDYEEAVRYYQQAIAYHERFSSTMNLSNLYSNTSLLLNEMEEFSKALYYLNKASDLHPDERSMAMIYVNKSVAFFGLNQPDSGVNYSLEAIRLGKKSNNPDVVASSNSNLGIFYLKKDIPSKSIGYLQEAIRTQHTTSPYFTTIAIISLGQAYYQLHDYKTAETYLLKGLAESDLSHISRDALEANKWLANVYEATGNYRKAFEHERIYRKMQDSTLNKQKIEIVNQLEIKYRTVQKDKDLMSKQLYIKEQKRSIDLKNTWLLIIALAAIALFLLLVAVYRNYRTRQKVQQKQLKILIQEQEIKELKAVMNGEERERVRIAREIHDSVMIRFSMAKMYLSTLIGKLSTETNKEDFTSILQQIDKGTTELRNTAHKLMPDILQEAGLIDALDNFCSSLEKDSDTEIEIQSPTGLPRFELQFELALYRILQELVQNIIKHAKAKHAIIQLTFREDLLNIVVEDNGIGIKKDDAPGNGMGLKSIIVRVNALNGKLDIESDPGVGTTITLEFTVLPL